MNQQLKDKMINSVITVTDQNRRPLANQTVTVTQTNHKFLFGTAAFDTVPLTNGVYSGHALEKAEQLAQNLLKICNAATLPFYWGPFEPQQGAPLTESRKNAAQWCLNHNLKTKGHPLCWHTMTADWLLNLDNAAILQAQKDRIKREVSDFRGLIDMWDVINEAVIMPIFDKYDNGITRICKQNGRIQTIKTMFETARAINPSAVFLINDFETSPAYDILIEGCLEAGIKFDVIGIQSHMHQGWWGLEKTHEILERFSRFNLPIHFTETTLVSGKLMPPEIVDLNDYQVTDWPSTPEGEERQAREAVQHYETLFAHPLVEGITWWDLQDGNWLHAPGGLIRKDGTTKPAYEELLKRIKGEWWLHATQMTTDASGTLHLSAFAGDYELSVNGQQQAFSIDKNTDNLMVAVN
jgi:endo-1,4-beta-xylanase